MSRWASASRRLSLLFSISRAFNRWASETDIPPNFDFQLMVWTPPKGVITLEALFLA